MQQKFLLLIFTQEIYGDIMPASINLLVKFELLYYLIKCKNLQKKKRRVDKEMIWTSKEKKFNISQFLKDVRLKPIQGENSPVFYEFLMYMHMLLRYTWIRKIITLKCYKEWKQTSLKLKGVSTGNCRLHS